MEGLIVFIINYVYSLGAIALIMEYLISQKKGEALALKLIDWNNYLSERNVDKLISKASFFLSVKFDRLYGREYFGQREWIISAAIAFTYCYFFYLAENSIGFDTSLVSQLAYWFIPNLVADIISINFTRWLLKKTALHPGKYLQYLTYDLLVVFGCFYIAFSFTITYIAIIGDYSFARVILHPFFLFQEVAQHFPDPIGLDSLFVIIIGSTAIIPTLLHIVIVSFYVIIKSSLPLLRALTHNLIEKMISFERHPIGVAVVISGIFLLPFVITFRFLF